eukprot:TRINITY_DN6364_c0_g1_i3.p1 TRINITY_DN6364_c0_g1~~TRINITY_DN6364_c0_g1_i3.p1  ORF type:complete len:186 (+),score=-15.63 TRINITY_DN6364_c0_g1_i3:331-888(+)
MQRLQIQCTTSFLLYISHEKIQVQQSILRVSPSIKFQLVTVKQIHLLKNLIKSDSYKIAQKRTNKKIRYILGQNIAHLHQLTLKTKYPLNKNHRKNILLKLARKISIQTRIKSVQQVGLQGWLPPSQSSTYQQLTNAYLKQALNTLIIICANIAIHTTNNSFKQYLYRPRYIYNITSYDLQEQII